MNILKSIKAFDRMFDIEVTRKGSSETVTVKLANDSAITKKWDGKEAVEIVLP